MKNLISAMNAIPAGQTDRWQQITDSFEGKFEKKDVIQQGQKILSKQSLGTGGKDIVGNKKDMHIPSKVEEVKKEVPPEEDWTED